MNPFYALFALYLPLTMAFPWMSAQPQRKADTRKKD